MNSSSADRKTLRRQLRNARRSLPAIERHHHTQAILSHILASRLFSSARDIAIYLPNDGEVDISLLAQSIWGLKKRCFLPVLGLRNRQRLWFLPYRRETQFSHNRFGIPEPLHARHERSKPIQSLDLILMPLVGFDNEGNRLGMGGGFYDRSLSFRHQRQFWKKPRLVGVAFECQRVKKLDFKPWDVPLDGIVTEKQLHLFSSSHQIHS